MKLQRRGHELAGAAGAMILLHGRGGSAEDIIGLAAAFDFPGVAYLAPEAAGHAWYPYSFLSPLEQNQPALTTALERVAQVVDDVTRAGIPREKLVIAGFSQGACLASEFVARNPAHYGGLIAPPSIHILLMFSCTPADDWMRSPGTVNAGQSWSYNIPARPGDVITLSARALDKFIKRERLFVVHDNVFFNQHGEVICSGRGWTIRPQ